ncbi:hypothetical protein AOLI_G00062810 [Acnodon oligacanthus]
MTSTGLDLAESQLRNIRTLDMTGRGSQPINMGPVYYPKRSFSERLSVSERQHHQQKRKSWKENFSPWTCGIAAAVTHLGRGSGSATGQGESRTDGERPASPITTELNQIL